MGASALSALNNVTPQLSGVLSNLMIQHPQAEKVLHLKASRLSAHAALQAYFHLTPSNKLQRKIIAVKNTKSLQGDFPPKAYKK